MCPDRGADNTPLKTCDPIFRVKNIGSYVARDIQIKWSVDPQLLRRAIEASPRLHKYIVRLREHRLGLFEGNISEATIDNVMNSGGARGKVMGGNAGSGYFGNYAASATTDIPYLAPEINNDRYQDAEMPFEISDFLQFVFIASLPENLTTSKTAIPVRASITWTDGKRQMRTGYSIRAEAFNISDQAPAGTPMPPPAEVLALVDFQITANNASR